MDETPGRVLILDLDRAFLNRSLPVVGYTKSPTNNGPRDSISIWGLMAKRMSRSGPAHY